MKNLIFIIFIILTSKTYSQEYLNSPNKYSIEQGLKMDSKKVEGLKVVIKKIEDLTYFNTHICKFKNLKDLEFSVHNFNDFNDFEFPDCLCKNRKLIFIAFSNNTDLTEEFPKSLLGIKSLKYLMIYGNFKALPDEITQLKKLKELTIKRTDNLILPSNLKKLRKLTFLELYDVGITTMPKGLDNLEVLLLQRNKIKKIPPEIFDYKNLWYLQISFNQIEEVSANIQFLTNLKSVKLNDNKIQKVDVNSFLKLDNLIWLELYNNQIPKNLQEKLYESLPKCKIRFDDFSRYQIE